jgi:hypothetical protein
LLTAAVAGAADEGVTVVGAPLLPAGCACAFCCLLAMRLATLAFEPKLVVPLGAALPNTVDSVNRNAVPDGTGSGTRG